MSAFVPTFLPEDQRNTSGAYQGPKYFTYQGQTLTDLRTEAEHHIGIDMEGLSEDEE